jgi:hypothetical protein
MRSQVTLAVAVVDGRRWLKVVAQMEMEFPQPSMLLANFLGFD